MKYLVLMVMSVALLTGCNTLGKPKQVLSGGAYQGLDTSKRESKKSDIAQVRTALAGQYINEGKLDEAQRQLEVAFKANSRYAPAYDMMGNLLRAEGSPINLQKADAYFRRAIALDANFVQARNNYGVYLSQTGRYNEAIQQFSIAGSTLGYADRASALENLGRTYLKVNNEKLAQDAFNRALEISPNTVVARLELIDILLNQRQTLQAKNYYDGLKSLWQMHDEPLPARLIYQGIRLSVLQNNPQERQNLSTLLLSQYPLSDEAKKLKTWLSRPIGVPAQ